MQIEVCANSLESALNAQKAGADRIELCVELGVGGLTPSFGLLRAVREKISIPVHVLIRPRSGDFTYSNFEFETILNDIELCVNMGFDGIVCGVLNSDFSIDIDRCRKMIELSKSITFTFHRAFDWVKDPFVGLKQLEDLGVNYILTSGQQKKAFDGIELLDALKLKTSKIIIMPGSGINLDNISLFKKRKFPIVHLSASVLRENINFSPTLSMTSLSYFQEGKVPVSDYDIIKGIVNKVK
ncbi:copper homeostasis protein CutC [Cellulophaga sp. HaHaR_3_176]|uniref:copper homeostasis protein CutC n=1 Tax=Cellulophaga sp. HaHaR_3_176 TaxID=1942464 RepID=UPI001C1F7999|nr:copper homeostasis protein CutC [Cellulophaga sp. HaHaR_3_176]QWX84046.1 copper homeostasis protein CutC [Cellulophaga sp. HaHaR_3_176]